MKSNTPAFQFYPQDFLVGTAMLSAEETGAYIRLLCYQWTNDGLPNDKAILARIAGCDGNAIASVWDKFGICQDGKLRNARLESIRVKQNEYRAKQKANSEKRWKNEENGKVGMPPHIPPHSSGISQQASQSDALQSSSSYYNIANAILPPVGGDEELKVNHKIDHMVEERLSSKVKQNPTPSSSSSSLNKINEAWIADIKRHYPTTDVDQELRNMDAWLANNPKRRKTRKFIVGWLNRCQPELPKEQPRQNDIPPEYDFSSW